VLISVLQIAASCGKNLEHSGSAPEPGLSPVEECIESSKSSQTFSCSSIGHDNSASIESDAKLALLSIPSAVQVSATTPPLSPVFAVPLDKERLNVPVIPSAPITMLQSITQETEDLRELNQHPVGFTTGEPAQKVTSEDTMFISTHVLTESNIIMDDEPLSAQEAVTIYKL
jgi:hypothetical protein